MAGSNHKNKQVKGALPCGNPQRFESSGVIKMTCKRKALDAGDEIETESEKHIKVMVQNQLKKDTTIKEQFSQHRAFTAASAFDPSADKMVGLHDLDQHKQVNELDSKVDYFRQCGLTDAEILLMLKKETSSDNPKSYGPDPAIEQRLIEAIEKKIDRKEDDLKKPDTFKGGLELSRQGLDLEKSITLQQNKPTCLPSGIITQKKHLPSHPDDPINNIPEIMKSINPKLEREPRRDRRRRRKLNRQMLRQQFYMKEVEHHPNEDLSSEEEMCNFISEEDGCENIDDCKLHGRSKRSNKGHGEMAIKEMTTDISSITEENIMANRLSLQEILGIDKFGNYQVGEANNIVYVKNLPNSTQEEDLIPLFGRYQSSEEQKIIYKLLSGRMKGQAFITFPDELTAGQAISLLNGYKLRDKPIILSYGKKKNYT